MALLDKNQATMKIADFGVASVAALSDPSLLPTVQNYKRQTASRLIALAATDIAKRIPDAEYLISRKLDGEFTVLIYLDGEVISLNPGGTVRFGLPWHQEAKELLDKAGVKQAMIAGEMYVTNDDDRRPRVHDVTSVVRLPKSVDDLQRIRFAVFDLLQWDNEAVETPYHETWKKIQSVFTDGPLVHTVETVAGKGHGEIESKFAKWVTDEGAEGIVVRSHAVGNFKIKPLYNIDALVIGFTESTDDRVGMMHDLLLGVARNDGSIHVLCRVGGGFSEDLRREMLSDLNDMIVDSEYAEVNGDHVAYQMVDPKLVIEISCLDLISQNTRGGPINRMVLNWNTTDSRYEVVQRMPAVSVISPQFLRVREDKSFNKDDIRISQITDVVPVDKSEVVAAEMSLNKSEVLQREVYTKVLKGETMVRKFLCWKTNKETESEKYPAFVIHYTDFSPNRKVPLSREVRVSDSEDQIIALWEELKTDYIKKGWELHSGSGSFIGDSPTEAAGTVEAESKPAKKAATKKGRGQKITDQESRCKEGACGKGDFS